MGAHGCQPARFGAPPYPVQRFPQGVRASRSNWGFLRAISSMSSLSIMHRRCTKTAGIILSPDGIAGAGRSPWCADRLAQTPRYEGPSESRIALDLPSRAGGRIGDANSHPVGAHGCQPVARFGAPPYPVQRFPQGVQCLKIQLGVLARDLFNVKRTTHARADSGFYTHGPSAAWMSASPSPSCIPASAGHEDGCACSLRCHLKTPNGDDEARE